jgi:hypothetical protein
MDLQLTLKAHSIIQAWQRCYPDDGEIGYELWV